LRKVTIPSAGPGPRWLGDAVQLALAAVLALVLLPASVLAVRAGEVSSTWAVVLVGALVTLHLSVATARRWPVPSYAVGALSCLLLLAAPDIADASTTVEVADYGPILLPSSLCFFPLLYAVSAHARAPWPNAALGVGLAGCGLTLARLWGFTGAPIDAWSWWLMLGTTALGGTIAAWALGRYRVTRAAWATQLAQRVAADERRRIAREMHDVVAHSLAVVVSHAEAGRLVVPGAPGRAPEILDTIAETGREALTEMRGLLGVLRDDSPSNDGAPTRPPPGLADLPTLIERMRAAGIEVEYAVPDELQVPPAVGLTVYRIVQEALTNVARHGGPRPAAEVRVEAAAGDLRVQVSNAGPVPANRSEPGRGLVGMRERAEAVRGTFDAGPADGGWQVRATIPL
jgi:signal transduction histidine kinase